MQSWTWRQVWQRRIQRHWLAEAAPIDNMPHVVADVCGIHAQVATSAELSLGLRVSGLTRDDVRRALWQNRALVKTYGLRGTLHVLPTYELGFWLTALRAKAQPRSANQFERDALPPGREEELLGALCDALDGRVLSRDELETEIAQRVGPWATEAVFPAFGGHWPRWQLWLRRAAVEGLLVFGPARGSRVTYARTDQWIGALPTTDPNDALREACRRFLEAYGPATHVEFARWFYTTMTAAQELMRALDLQEVDVEGWRAYLPRESADPPSTSESVHLLPQYDCYVVGSFPREQFIPEPAGAARKMGTAAPFNVLLLNGVIAGFWERNRRGKSIEVRVDAFSELSPRQRNMVEQQAARIGEIVKAPVELSFGPVDARPHL